MEQVAIQLSLEGCQQAAACPTELARPKMLMADKSLLPMIPEHVLQF